MTRARDLADSADKDIAGTLAVDGLDISVAAGGSSEMLFSDNVSGRAKILYDHGASPNEEMGFEIAGSRYMTIENGGNVGIGVSDPSQKLDLVGTGNSGTGSVRAGGVGSGTQAAFIAQSQFGSASFGTYGSYPAVLNSSNSPMVYFNTNASGRAVFAEGITFNGDTAAANALNDYEFGTWNPSVGGNATYTTVNHGRYTKIGNIVSLNFTLQVNVLGTGSTATISGLPFTSENTGWIQTGCVSYYAGLATSINFIALYVSNNSTQINFVGNNSNTTTVSHNGFGLIGNQTLITCSVTYRAA
tara:strand:- start:694 stop:1599 length:906 start_codon:yes stop_codon:yes gene_type:complete